MRKIEFEDVFKALKDLKKGEDYSSSVFDKKSLEFPTTMKEIDFSEAKGNELILEFPFINRIDLSNSKIKILKIIGKVNILDLSGAKIDLFEKGQLEAVIIDRFKSKIGEEI